MNSLLRKVGRWAFGLVVAGGGVLATNGAAGNLLVNGDFESQPFWQQGVSQDNGYTALTGSQMPGWTIEPGRAATVHVSPGPYLTIGGAYSVNLDGEGYQGRNANFYQDFSTANGESYELSFDWQSWGLDTVPTSTPMRVSVTEIETGTVLWEGSYLYEANAAHPVHHVAAMFTGTGKAARLRVEETAESGYNDNAYVVDNFAVIVKQPVVSILVNGDFEAQPNWQNGISQNNGYTALTGGQMPGWTIEADHAVTIHIAPGPFLTIAGAYSANLDGEGHFGHNANLYQDFATVAGEGYTFSFDWQSWGFDSAPTTQPMRISITDIVTAAVLYEGFFNYDGAGEHPVHHVSTNFVGTGNAARLRIQESPESGYNDNTYVVDNFVVLGAANQLRIQRAANAGANEVVISWPAALTGYVLESTTALPAGAGGWTAVGDPAPVKNGNWWEVTVSATGTQRYFRLRR